VGGRYAGNNSPAEGALSVKGAVYVEDNPLDATDILETGQPRTAVVHFHVLIFSRSCDAFIMLANQETFF
jgi:hypothetical protein